MAPRRRRARWLEGDQSDAHSAVAFYRSNLNAKPDSPTAIAVCSSAQAMPPKEKSSPMDTSFQDWTLFSAMAAAPCAPPPFQHSHSRSNRR